MEGEGGRRALAERVLDPGDAVKTTAIVPVKRFRAAKQRLVEAVGPQGRAALAKAMLADVLSQVTSAELIERVIVVTGEGRAEKVAMHRAQRAKTPIEVFRDPDDRGHSEAATLGIIRAKALGARAVALLPGDCPLLAAGELDAALARLAPDTVAVVPDRHGTGTNALLMCPPGCHRPGLRARQSRPPRRARAPARARGRGRRTAVAGPGSGHRRRPRGAGGGSRWPQRAGSADGQGPRRPRDRGLMEVLAVTGVGEVAEGDRLGALLAAAAPSLEDRDVVVVSHKVVSKAEGRLRPLSDVEPTDRATGLAGALDKDPRFVQLVLDESRSVIRAERGVLIVETRQGWICANAGIDTSNVPGHETVVLLPEDADASARRIRREISEECGVSAGGRRRRQLRPRVEGRAGRRRHRLRGARAAGRLAGARATPWGASWRPPSSPLPTRLPAPPTWSARRTRDVPAAIVRGLSATSPPGTGPAPRRFAAPSPRTCSARSASGSGSPSLVNSKRVERLAGGSAEGEDARALVAGNDLALLGGPDARPYAGLEPVLLVADGEGGGCPPA